MRELHLATRLAAALGLCLLALAARPTYAQQAEGPAPAGLDELLHWEGDRFGTLGSSGWRLSAAELKSAPGFQGRFTCGLGELELTDPLVLSLTYGQRDLELRLVSSDWYPSHSELRWRGRGFELRERKFVHSRDVLVVECELCLTQGKRPREVQVWARSAGLMRDDAAARHANTLHVERAGTHLYLTGLDSSLMVSASETWSLMRELTLEPDVPVRLCYALGVGPRKNLIDGSARMVVNEQVLEKHVAEYQAWFDEHLPRFECDQAQLVEAWAYHAWLLRRNHVRRAGFRQYDILLQDSACDPSGPALTLASLPSVLWEARWMRGTDLLDAQLFEFLSRAREDDLFLPDRVPGPVDWRMDWRLTVAVVDAFSVHDEPEVLLHALPFLQHGAEARYTQALALAEDDQADVSRAMAEVLACARARRALGEFEEADRLQALLATARERGLEAVDATEADDRESVRGWVAEALRDLYAGGREHPVRTVLTPERERVNDALPSRFLDRMVRWVGGLRPRENDVIELRPRYTALEHFAFRGLRYKGWELELYWDKPDGKAVREGVPEGYCIYVDGRLRHRSEALIDVEVDASH